MEPTHAGQTHASGACGRGVDGEVVGVCVEVVNLDPAGVGLVYGDVMVESGCGVGVPVVVVLPSSAGTARADATPEENPSP